MRQSVHADLCNAAGGIQKSFDDIPGVVDRSLRLTVGHAPHSKLVRPGSFNTQLVSNDARQGWTRDASDSREASSGDTFQGSPPASPGATEPRVYPGRS